MFQHQMIACAIGTVLALASSAGRLYGSRQRPGRAWERVRYLCPRVKNLDIVVIGLGYVGLPLAVALARQFTCRAGHGQFTDCRACSPPRQHP